MVKSHHHKRMTLAYHLSTKIKISLSWHLLQIPLLSVVCLALQVHLLRFCHVPLFWSCLHPCPITSVLLNVFSCSVCLICDLIVFLYLFCVIVLHEILFLSEHCVFYFLCPALKLACIADYDQGLLGIPGFPLTKKYPTLLSKPIIY